MTLAERIAHFWSEWTDDAAPTRERTEYLQAAKHFLLRFDVTEKTHG